MLKPNEVVKGQKVYEIAFGCQNENYVKEVEYVGVSSENESIINDGENYSIPNGWLFANRADAEEFKNRVEEKSKLSKAEANYNDWVKESQK